MNPIQLDLVLTALQLAASYILYIKEHNLTLHEEADGTPSAANAVDLAISWLPKPK